MKPILAVGTAAELRRSAPAVRLAAPAGALVLALALLLPTLCCSRAPAAAGTRFPMVLIGVDGMEWSVLRPLLAQGKLPIIKGLMDRGTYGSLTTMNPTLSPVIWTSIATGKVPQKHGIDNFVYVSDATGKREIHVYTSGQRKTKAFWNILGDYGLHVDCVGWWITWPAESVNGVMVSQTNTSGFARNATKAIMKGGLIKGVEGQVWPASRQKEVMSVLDSVEGELPRITEQTFGRLPHPADGLDRLLWDESQWSFRADNTYARVAQRLLGGAEPVDLFAIYFGGPDVVSHRFWRFAHPDQFAHPPSAEQIENFGRIIDDEYVAVDRMIGEILATQPPDVTVVILSDHGFHAVNQDHNFRLEDPPLLRNSGGHNGAPPTVFIAAGRFIATPEARRPIGADSDMPILGSVLDVAPTLFALKGIPVGGDMDGHPLVSLIAKERLAEAPIRSIPTHDSPEWLAHRAAKEREAGEDAERLEQLRSLGYNVSGAPAPPQEAPEGNGTTSAPGTNSKRGDDAGSKQPKGAP